jgi:hypothetical protein
MKEIIMALNVYVLKLTTGIAVLFSFIAILTVQKLFDIEIIGNQNVVINISVFAAIMILSLILGSISNKLLKNKNVEFILSLIFLVFIPLLYNIIFFYNGLQNFMEHKIIYILGMILYTITAMILLLFAYMKTHNAN